jgi:ribosomal-protein-alanine N-acetyltransferase
MPGTIVSRGDRVSLRTAEPEDAAFLQRGYTDPEIRYPMGNPVQNQPDIREGIEENGDDGERFVATLDGEDAGPGDPDEADVERVGCVSVDDVSWRRPDLGYWLAPEYHGEGYGREAVSLLVDFVFRTYEHPAVGAVAYEFNEASRGLLESLGFEEEGVTHSGNSAEAHPFRGGSKRVSSERQTTDYGRTDSQHHSKSLIRSSYYCEVWRGR